jgi:regulator of nonsense transcripts 1
MTDVHGREFMGRAIHAEGKETTIRAQSATTSGTFQRVRVVGREDLTNSERARNEFVLLVLRGERTLAESPFVRYIWFPSEDELQRSPVESTSHNISEEMNDSQRKVIAAMVSEQTDLIITHGRLAVLCSRLTLRCLPSRSAWDGQDDDYI